MTKGSCLCGTITYEFTGEPALSALCHCNDCSKWSGAGVQSMVVVPRTSFTILTGTPKSYTTIGAESGLEHKRFFCGDCGSPLYSQPDSMPDVNVVRAGGLDDGKDDIVPGVEFFTKGRKGWIGAVEGAEQKGGMS